MIAVLPPRSSRGRSPRNRSARRSELGPFLGLDGCELVTGGADGADDLVAHDADAAFADRPHRQLLVPGRAELADHDHVERRTERVGDLAGDGDTTPGQAEHHDVGSPEALQLMGQLPARLHPIGEDHRLPA